jgi:hypothetical protein
MGHNSSIANDANRIHNPNPAMNDNPTEHPRKPYDRLFDRFNSIFERIASREKLVFRIRSGPNIGRSLRFDNDSLERGIFLELKDHWTKSNISDPEVTFSYAARFRPKAEGFPVYFYCKKLYEGKISEIQDIEEKLTTAISEVKLVSQEQVTREGKCFTDWSDDT